MALSKVNFNSLNLTPTASKVVKFNSNNNGLEAGDVGGSLVLISTSTASSSSTIDITSWLDSTYKEYIIKFINIHPATDNVNLQIYFSTNSGSGYSIATQSTFFVAYHDEADSATTLDYFTGSDAANQTGGANFMSNTGNDNDQGGCMEFFLFNPSSTTFIKKFIRKTVIINHLYFYNYIN